MCDTHINLHTNQSPLKPKKNQKNKKKQVTCLPADLILDDTSLSAIRSAGYSRIPVCRPFVGLGGIQEEDGGERPSEALTPPRGQKVGSRCVSV